MNFPLAIIHELDLDDFKKSILFIQKEIKPSEILCIKAFELNDCLLDDYFFYTCHLNLSNELRTHENISLKIKAEKSLNNFLFEKNIFDDKYLFYQFLLANNLPCPETLLLNKESSNDFHTKILKPRFGTEAIDFADYSLPALRKILTYDDALLQEKINIHQEVKILVFCEQVFANQQINEELKRSLKTLITCIKNHLAELSPKIYSIDILISKEDFYFLELNLRPGAFFRFTHSINL
jgi:hypothetical protein